MLSDRCLSVCPVCLSSVCLSVTLVYCGQTVGWIKTKLGTQVVLGPGHIVLDGDSAPPPQRGTAPNFRPISLRPNGCSAHVYCGQTAGWIKTVLGMEVGLSPEDFVLDGTWAFPKFSSHVYYSYCDFVRTLHRRKAFKFKFKFSILCILFLESLIVLSLSAMHS